MQHYYGYSHHTVRWNYSNYRTCKFKV